MTSNRWTGIGVAVAVMAVAALCVTAWLTKQQADRLALEKASLTQTQSELQKTRSALDQSIEQAEKQTHALNDAVKDSEQYQENQRARAIRGRRLATGLMAVASMKTEMTEFFYTEGKWPSSNREFGAPEPSSFRADGVKAIGAVPGGKIRLVFIDNAGKTETVWMTAIVNAKNYVSWQCVTPDIPDIALIVSDCSYQTP